MSKRIEFHDINRHVWFTYDYAETPTSIHVIFTREFQNDERAEEAWKKSLTTKQQMLRLDATKQALKNCKVERAFFVGPFETDPCKDTEQHVFTNTNLYDILKNRAMNPEAQLVELKFEDLGIVKGSAPDHINMFDILKACGTFIAEDILDFEAEYYAKRHKKKYILPGDYEEVLDNMSKDELLDASKIVAGEIPVSKDTAALFEKLKNKDFTNAKPLKPEKITWKDVPGIGIIKQDDDEKPWTSIRDILKIEYEKNRDKIDSLCEAFDNIPDSVNHPRHYKSSGGLETIDCIEAFTEELSGDLGYCVGNAIKYLCRFNKKGKPVEDLEKAKWYVDRAIKNIKKREE